MWLARTTRQGCVRLGLFSTRANRSQTAEIDASPSVQPWSMTIFLIATSVFVVLLRLARPLPTLVASAQIDSAAGS